MFPFTHYEIMRSKIHFERGFNYVWLETSHSISAKCELKDYYFPNYDFGINIFKPMHWFYKKDCKREFAKEHYLFFDPKLNNDMVNNNFQVYPDMKKVPDEKYNNYTRL